MRGQAVDTRSDGEGCTHKGRFTLRTHRIFTFLFSALVCLTAATAGFAQSTNATLGGSVSDSSGALIPGVTITVTNTNTGIVQTSLTNESGVYQFAALSTGTYKIIAALPGFQTQVINGFTLGIAQNARQNFTLQVSAVTQAVEVSIDANTEIGRAHV